jgi:putative ABC transport system permease protein
MKYLPLVWAALLRRKMRTVLTLLSVVAAFLLFGLLDSVRSAFVNAGQSVLGADRLVTTSKISPFLVLLPKSLATSIQGVPGVAEVTYGSELSGFYQNAKNSLPIEAHADNYFDLYPEWVLPARELEAFLHTRTGAVVEESLARKFHWKIGDKIPIQTTLTQKNGSNTWTFDLVGIFRITDPNRMDDERQLAFHWEYLDKARPTDNGTVGWYILRVADLSQADRVAHEIDALSANSDHETKTEDENAYDAALVKQFANMGLIAGSIMGAVGFTLALLTGNTMAQTVRERIPELAILKTIGFSARGVMGLVLAESILLLVIGAVLGLTASVAVVGGLRSTLAHKVPTLPVTWAVWLRGMTLAIIIGFFVGLLPALRGMRLRVVDALSGR